MVTLVWSTPTFTSPVSHSPAGTFPTTRPRRKCLHVAMSAVLGLSAEEERLSGQLAAVEMLKSGTTSFLEAGTIRFLDEVIDGLNEAGITEGLAGGYGTSRLSRRSTRH